MSQDRPPDPEGFTTSIRPLGNGKWGCRVYHNGIIVQEDNDSKSRQEAAKTLKMLLRWVDKLGYDSSIASASRDRFFCGRKIDNG